MIGGAAGAVPVLVGWAAVTDSLAWAPIVLFVVMFCWTPPHFWALAIRYADDYRAADVPMLPAVVPIAEAARQMIGYTVALVVADAASSSRSPTSAGSTASRPSCSAPVFLGATIGLGPAPDAGGQHAGVRATPSPTSRCCSPR